MNVDFLREGSNDCPIIRLYNGQSEDYDKLLGAINNLLSTGGKFDVLLLEGFHHDSSISSFTIAKVDKYIQTIETPMGAFHAYWTNDMLSDVLIRLKNYQKENNGYYWLDDETLDIEVLLSYSGKW